MYPGMISGPKCSCLPSDVCRLTASRKSAHIRFFLVGGRLRFGELPHQSVHCGLCLALRHDVLSSSRIHGSFASGSLFGSRCLACSSMMCWHHLISSVSCSAHSNNTMIPTKYELKVWRKCRVRVRWVQQVPADEFEIHYTPHFTSGTNWSEAVLSNFGSMYSSVFARDCCEDYQSQGSWKARAQQFSLQIPRHQSSE